MKKSPSPYNYLDIKGRKSLRSEEREILNLDNSAVTDDRSNESDSDDASDTDNLDSTQNISNTPETSLKKLDSHKSDESNYIKITYTPESYTYTKSAQSNCVCPLVTAFVVIVAIGLSLYFFQQPTNKSCSFNKFHQKYPNQENRIWHRLQVGIENILNKRVTSPAVYLFVHEDHGVEEIIKDIALRFSSCFGGDMKPVEIESRDFTSKDAEADYGIAIEKYKMKIKKGKVILIANLNEIPATAARALHAICDTISPIANEVIIILKLVVPNVEGHAVQSARDTLENLWALKLKSHELDALITRVTEDVIVLRS